MTDFSDMIRLEVKPMAAFDHVAELEKLVHDRISTELQHRVRSQLDPGLDPKRAMEIGSLKVTPEGSTYVIHTDDSQKAIAFAESSVKPQRAETEAKSVDSLFEMSSGVPAVQDGKLVYKTVTLETLFGEQKQREQDEQLSHIVEDTLRTQLPDAYEDAFKKMATKYPESK